jgi:N-acetylmuramoyl-L-alanine amidase
LLVAFGVALAPGLSLALSAPLTVLTETQRREIVAVSRGDIEFVAVDLVIQGLGVSLLSNPSGGAATLTYQKHEVGLYGKKSLASVDGDLRLLSAPVTYEDGHWLVPVDSLPRLLAPLLEKRVEWRAASRVLAVGSVSVPRITVGTYVSGDVARVVLEATEKVPFRVQQESGRVTVAIPRDLLDVGGFQQQRLTGGIVESVAFVGGKENVFAVNLGRRFQTLKATEQDSPSRLVLEFQAPPLPAQPPAPHAAGAGAPAPAPRAPRPAAPAEPPVVRTVVIDPGHGGEEVGAKGPAGMLEKDVTLAIARKLRAQIVNTLGYQVFLTRDIDVDLPLDQRTAIANNYKADLFLSIHANAHRVRGATGAEVYFLSYQASEEERRLVQLEGEAPALATAAPGSDLALILWDMAQSEHLEASSALASRIQEELALAAGSEGRGVKQAPFRVLVGAAMPAALVELAFISNPEEEKLLASEAWQSKVAIALARGIARFEQERSGRTTFTRAGTAQ